MHPLSPVITAEIQMVAKIVRDECWLEGERRGRPVLPDDPVIQDRVAGIILRSAGSWMRQQAEHATNN